MSDPTDRNRLGSAASPYLRQHADNPVNWQPWDDAAREAARERDVPIFLSIGYAACHWCHVMEEESFSDPEVAAVLNERYVPIKVDREERPDVDSLYMTVSQQVTGRGGWPLNVWLTPDGDPFFVGTYFPPDARQGRPGFRDLLAQLAEQWETERTDLEERAEEWTAAARGELETVPDDPGEAPGTDLLGDAADALLRRADRQHGGFGRSPKFPQPSRLRLLLRADARTDREDCRDAATRTLDAMARGGVHDHVAGGFHRYATDQDWTVPHFEKMLYDNAEIPRAYLDGYRVTGAEKYADVARKTLAFVDEELGHPEGGFYSTLDARSPPPGDPDGDHEEGAFYVWTPEQVRAAVGDERRADLFCARYGVTEAGNFEGDTVLTLSESVPSLAEEFGMDEDAVRAELATAMGDVADARAERPRPARDEKVLAGWNGLAISAFADAALALDDADAGLAVDALDFVREHLWDDGDLARRYERGDAGVDGYLEDYAFLARGALDCYQATGDVGHLDFALALARELVARFFDADAGTLYFTQIGRDDLGVRPQQLGDQSTPSSVGVAVETLLALSHVAPEAGFGDVAERVLETHAERIESEPFEHATLVAAADAHAVGHVEFTVVADAVPDDWRAALGRRYVPDRLLSRRPADDEALAAWLDRLDLAEAPPIWADRGAPGDEPTLYVCRRACSPPLTDVADADEWIDDLAP